MRTKLIVKKTPNLTAKEYKACHRLNFGSAGLMRDILQEFSAYEDNRSFVVMIWDEKKTTLLAWSIVFPWKLEVPKTKYMAYFYVRGKYRRQGLGTRLSKAVRKYFKEYKSTRKNSVKKIIIDPHDKRATAFFNSVKLKAR